MNLDAVNKTIYSVLNESFKLGPFQSEPRVSDVITRGFVSDVRTGGAA